MKKLTFLAVFAAIALVCTSALAITITYSGAVTLDGAPVVDAGILNLVDNAYDYEAPGIGPLVQLFNGATLVAETTVGAGQYVTPTNLWSKLADFEAVMGDVLTVKVFATPDGSGPFAEASMDVKAVGGGDPDLYKYDFGVLNIEAIPEPSILLAGLALLAFRKKH